MLFYGHEAAFGEVCVKAGKATASRLRSALWVCALLAAVLAACVLIRLTGITQLWIPTYTGADFGIEPYVSSYDADGDGLDDQSDIVASAHAYVATKPRYGSAYYEGGWPDDGRGVCTDVVAYALLGAGYDVRELLYEDVTAHPDGYSIPVPDANIDYRRVEELYDFFSRNTVALTLDPSAISEWQGGDIVFFDGHVGVVSERRNSRGVPLVIHHERILQVAYEEDILESRPIIGHFRV